MNDPVQTLKGFRDFTGTEARKRLWLIAQIRTVMERFGFEPLETPALEYESLLMGKYGDEADKLVYSFEDRGGRRVALRYDQTVPTARIVAQYRDLPLPYKRYQIQPVWRADKPQQGRYREFLQCDADIIGSSSDIADAEIVALYISIYNQIGLKSLRVKVNDRSVLIKKLRESSIEESMIASVIQSIDKLDKKTENEVQTELLIKGISESTISNIFRLLNEKNEPESIALLRKLLQAYDIPDSQILYSPTLARGLDYYTGLIFEGVIPEYPVGSVGGGGRYDKLLNSLVEVDLPAVGFGLGFDRTLEAAEALNLIPSFSSSASVLVTIFSPELVAESTKTAFSLRSRGIPTTLYPEKNKGLDKQLKYANRMTIPFVIIIGPEEIEKRVIKLKNMQTGEQIVDTEEKILNIIST